MADKRGTSAWVWVLVGVVVLLVIGFAAFVGIATVTVTRNMQVTRADEPSAERAFEDARARFKGQVPLVRFEGDTMDPDVLVSRAELDRRMATYAGPAPQQMWMMIHDPKEQKLVRVPIPFWLLKMSPSSDVTLDVPGLGKHRANVSTAEIQRAGPGLFLDQTIEGARVLIWTE